jgi:excisionase family DNA binding protein
MEVGAMDLLTVQETAEMLRVNPMTVRRYIASGRLAAVRIGRRIRVPREALDALARPIAAGASTKPEQPFIFKRPSAEEIARRQELGKRILENRKKRNIAPLTSVDLIHMAREDDEQRWRDRGF